MNNQWMNKGDKAPTWSTAILFGQVDVEMGVWLRVSLGRGKKHKEEKKRGGHLALKLLIRVGTYSWTSQQCQGLITFQSISAFEVGN